MSNMNDEELQKLFMWVDTIPLSRSKKNINRDFSDAVLAAEVIGHYFPRLVDMHNYPATSNSGQKLANWRALNVKVLKKLKYQQAPPMLEDLAHAKTGAVEVFLHALQYKLAKYKADKSGHTASQTTEGEAQSVSIEQLSIHGGRSPTAPALTGPGQACKSFAAIPVSSSSSPSPTTSPARQHVLSEPSSSPSVFSSASLSLPGEAGAANSLISRGENSGKRHPRAEEQPSVDEEIMMEKEETLEELRQTVDMLQLKVAKLEQLLRVKEMKIDTLGREVARLSLTGKPDPDGATGGGFIGDGSFSPARSTYSVDHAGERSGKAAEMPLTLPSYARVGV